MRKTALTAILFITCILLTGCMQTEQIEDLAFAIVLGVDLSENDEIEASIIVPKISGQRGESSSGGSADPNHLIYSSRGSSFDEALTLLQWAVPRRLDLSQIKLIVVSEALARSEHYARTADTIMATPRLYTAANLAVCKSTAKEFIGTLRPVIGTRIASELTAAFRDYTANGFIPDVNFADVYYKSKSVYSDMLAIYAEVVDDAVEESAPAAAILPQDPQTKNIKAQSGTRLLGAAVFRGEKMVGKLSGEQSMYCKILRGEQQTFPYSIDGKTVGLVTLGKPEIYTNTSCDPMQINVRIRLSVVSSSRKSDTERLQRALEESFEETIGVCRSMGAEPFLFAERAAGSFLTIDEWRNFDWNSRFRNSVSSVNVHISSKDI